MAVTTAAVVGTAAVGAISAKKGADAAKEAAETQAGAALTSVAEQRRQFDISQEQFAPFRQAGLSALQQQLALLGLPGLDPTQFGPQQGAGQAPTGPGGEQLFRRSTVARGRFPVTFKPVRAPAPQEPGVPFPEPVSREDALAAFAETPGQQFLRERQEKALLRSAGAIGGLGGGNIRTALQEQAFGRAATQLGEFQNRLAALSGSAQTATSNVAQLGAQSASQIGQGLQQAGASRASGILGAQQAQAQGLQSIAGGIGGIFSGGFGGGGGGALTGRDAAFAAARASDIRLKENIVKIGQSNSGLSWYSWDWNEEGIKIAGDQPTVGVIAQEVKELFPEAVIKGKNGFLMVNYSEIH